MAAKVSGPAVNVARKVLQYRARGQAVPAQVLAAARRINQGQPLAGDQSLVISYIGGINTGSKDLTRKSKQVGGTMRWMSNYGMQLNLISQGGVVGAVAAGQTANMAVGDVQRFVASQGFKRFAEGVAGAMGLKLVSGRKFANGASAVLRTASASVNAVGVATAIGVAGVNAYDTLSGRNSVDTLRALATKTALQSSDPTSTARQREMSNLEWSVGKARSSGLGAYSDFFLSRRNQDDRDKLLAMGINNAIRERGLSLGINTPEITRKARERYFRNTYGATLGPIADYWDKKTGGSRATNEGVAAEAEGIITKAGDLQAQGWKLIEQGKFGAASAALNRANMEGAKIPWGIVNDPASMLPGILTKRENDASYALSQMAQHGRQWE